MGVAAKSDDRRMLDEEKHVADALLFAEFDQSFLEAKSGCVIAAAEIEDGDHACNQDTASEASAAFVPRLKCLPEIRSTLKLRLRKGPLAGGPWLGVEACYPSSFAASLAK
jgi:hypothetical protein